MQELVVDTFVPNDALIVGGAGLGISLQGVTDDDEDSSNESTHHSKNSVVVCTGANACGKVPSSEDFVRSVLLTAHCRVYT